MSSSQRTLSSQQQPSRPEPPRKELDRMFGLSAGLRLQDRFLVGEKVSSGGMSDIFAGLDLDTGSRIALKVASSDHLPIERANRYIDRERVALGMARHQNIVSLFGSGEVEGRNYLVLEFIEGDSLEMRIKTGPFQWPEASGILCGLCDALATVHVNGVIHGDLTASNVSLSGAKEGPERPILLDFGLVKFMDPALDEGRTPSRDVVIGTMRYLAPEQTMPGTCSDFDHRADIYSFGVLAYRMLSGVYPFDSWSDYEIIKKHWGEAPRPLRELAPLLPPEGERIVLKALAKDPAERFQSVGSIREALSAV